MVNAGPSMGCHGELGMPWHLASCRWLRTPVDWGVPEGLPEGLAGSVFDREKLKYGLFVEQVVP